MKLISPIRKDNLQELSTSSNRFLSSLANAGPPYSRQIYTQNLTTLSTLHSFLLNLFHAHFAQISISRPRTFKAENAAETSPVQAIRLSVWHNCGSDMEADICVLHDGRFSYSIAFLHGRPFTQPGTRKCLDSAKVDCMR